MKGILFHFDRQQGMTLSFLLFFSLYHCLLLWPGACEANHAAEAPCGQFNIISLTETSDLFLYVEHEEMWKAHCHPRQMHEDTLCLVRWQSGHQAEIPVLHDAAHFIFFYSPLKYCVWTSFLFFISCSFWFWENHHAYTMESFYFFTPLSRSAIPPTHVSLHFALLAIKIGPLDKRGSDAFRQGKRCDHPQSINFTSGVTTSAIFFCILCPQPFQPL